MRKDAQLMRAKANVDDDRCAVLDACKVLADQHKHRAHLRNQYYLRRENLAFSQARVDVLEL